jgi:hypothetical protein
MMGVSGWCRVLRSILSEEGVGDEVWDKVSSSY